MITLKVYGVFRKLCRNQKVHSISNVTNIRQVLSYLTVNFSSLRKYIFKTSNYLVYVFLNGKSISVEEAQQVHLFKGDELTLIPSIEGSGKTGTIILGAILVIVGALLWEFGGAALIEYGVQMMIAGAVMIVSGLMMPTVVSPEDYDSSIVADSTKTSYGFGGTIDNLTKQGNSIPVGYGRMRVGSQVISAGLRAENI